MAGQVRAVPSYFTMVFKSGQSQPAPNNVWLSAKNTATFGRFGSFGVILLFGSWPFKGIPAIKRKKYSKNIIFEKLKDLSSVLIRYRSYVCTHCIHWIFNSLTCATGELYRTSILCKGYAFMSGQTYYANCHLSKQYKGRTNITVIDRYLSV